MHASWREVLAPEFDKPYFRELVTFVRRERREHVIFPPGGEVFAAFDYPFEAIRVCILGQDPYHNAGQAHGLCFSVKPPTKPPPSLVNIFQELEADVPGWKRPAHGCLTQWAERGVLLLNTVLTVRAHEPGSHRGEGWEQLTNAAIRALDGRQKPVVFILWGRQAREKKALLDTSLHAVIESPHPSPMSARSGFFGSRPFSRANEALEVSGQQPVDWSLESSCDNARAI